MNKIFSNEIVNFIDLVIREAIDNFASDIHFKQYGEYLDISYRIYGNLYKKYEKFNKYNSLECIARLKIISNMNVTEKRMPQDGNYFMKYNDKRYDFRFATLPLSNGEELVIRILNSTIFSYDLEKLGFSKLDKDKILNNLIKRYGLILISGATGSGKSTTLKSFVKNMNLENKRVIMIEDPIENKIDEIIQIQVNESINLTFSNILRATLRMDPDIIIISEIRDEVTAQIAIRAALTGHLVISTIHSNDVLSTINRLIEMGIKKYLVLDSLIMIVTQKLEYIKKLNRQLMFYELLEINNEVKNILMTYDDKLLQEKNLKNIYYNSINLDGDIYEKISNI